jgi:hypothetical protein
MTTITFPDGKLKTSVSTDATVLGELSAGLLQLGAYGTYDVQMNPLGLTITNTNSSPQRQAVLNNEQLNVEEGDSLTNIKKSVIKTQTTNDGTEYKVEIVSDPALYMEGMGMILDTTPTAPATAFRTSLTSTQLQSNADPFNINIENLSLDGNQSIEGQVITADANGKPVWETPQPIVSTLEYYITATSPFFQYPPVAPTQALITSYQYYGWYFINDVDLRNIAWFFAPDYEMTVADVKGLYMNYFNITTTSNDNLPFLTIYTKPTGVNDFFPNFAHSARTFAPTFSTSPASPYCSFMNISGIQPDPFPYGHILGGMVIANTRGEYLPTEEVLAVAIGTSTSSPVGQANFIFQKLGICLEQGNAELIMNPQNILDPTVNSIKTTTIIDKNSQTGSAGQILSSTSTGIDWIDAPSSGWVGTATSNLDMDNYSIVDVNNVGMVNGTLTASSSTVATDTTTVASNGVVVETTILGSDYTNTITGDKILMETPFNTRKTNIVPAEMVMELTQSGGIKSTLTNIVGQAPALSLSVQSLNDPPDFPFQFCSLTTSGLSATNSFGWNLDVPKLLLNFGASTTGQSILADANGRPVWGTPVVALTNVQQQLTSGTGGLGGGLNRLTQVNFTVVNGGKYLVMGSFNMFNSVSNTGSIWCGLCQQPEIITANADALNLTTGVRIGTTTLNDSNSLAVQRNSGVASGDSYTLSPSYVWTSNVDGVRTFSAWALAQASAPTYSGSARNANLQITRIA